MNTNAPAGSPHARWATIRLILGMLQMAGVVVSLVLLFQTGVSVVALIAVTGTSAVTTISVLLFGSSGGRRRSGTS